MTLLISEREVTDLLDIRTAISAVEEVVRDQAEGVATNRPRQRVHGSSALLHVMPAADRRLDVFGFKAYSTAKRGTRFLVMLYDGSGGDLLAIIEADRLGQMRTGAASGVATKYMARQDAAGVGIFGTGWQAETQLLAVCAVRAIKSVKAYSRSPEHRNSFAGKMTRLLGMEVIPVETPEEAVRGQPIVITATAAREPVLRGECIEPGTHVNAAGSNYLSKSEIDVKTIQRASVIAVDSVEQARIEAGDLLPAIERGVIYWESVTELGRIVAGHVPGRKSPEDITVFKSVGIALWDIATALRVYNLARERGVGREVAVWEPGN